MRRLVRVVQGTPLIAILSLSIALSGCSYYIDKNNSPQATPMSPEQKAQLSYSVVRAQVFAPRCISCHGTSGGVNLETYQSTIVHIDAIERAALVTKTMPKGGSLTSTEAEILRAWIEVGTPEKPDQSDPDPTPLEPKFESIKANIFTVRCITCHSPAGSAKQILLDTKDDLLNSPRDLVLPGNPDESGLVIAVERQDQKRMPPPQVGGPLSAKEIQTIREWIQNGAQD